MRVRVVIALILALAAPHTASAASTPCWEPPIEAPIVDQFRPPACPWCPGNRGLEYATRPGQSVRAVAAGVVTYSGAIAGDHYVVVETGTGLRVTYGLVERRLVQPGAAVVAGQIIATTTGSFHFGVRRGDRYLDPAPLLGTWRYRPRLVPTDNTPRREAPPPRLRCGNPHPAALS